MKVLVCVEGPIGVGKSTLVSELRKRAAPGLVTLQEPVDEWKAVEVARGKNMLAAMYDKSLSSAVFQLSILQSRFGPLVRSLCNKSVKVVVSERGPWSEKLVFAKSNLTNQEFACYEYAHSSLVRDLFSIVGKVKVIFIHLELPTEKILERIDERGRAEEKDIGIGYLQTLEEAHLELKAKMTTPEALGSAEAITAVRHIVIRADRPVAELVSLVSRVLDAEDSEIHDSP
jgi:deoxyadenosine/deoxycytidine kinase